MPACQADDRVPPSEIFPNKARSAPVDCDKVVHPWVHPVRHPQRRSARTVHVLAFGRMVDAVVLHIAYQGTINYRTKEEEDRIQRRERMNLVGVLKQAGNG